jgi:5-carboxymethyl-2-hydroxymuconate isomerase
MPHFTIEHSANLDLRVDMAKLELGEGRDLATRKKAGDHVFEVLSTSLRAAKFALSFGIQINDNETSWKRNNIHEALKAEAASA